MRIVHAIENLPGIGGAERITLTLAGEQQAMGHDVTICAAQEGYLTDACQARDIPVVLEPLLNPPLADPARNGDYAARVADTFAQLGPDILHGHLRHAGVAVAAAARKLNVPMVYTHHTILFDFFLCTEFAQDHRFPVISVSRAGAELLKRDAPEPDLIHHVPNGIHPVSGEIRLPRRGARPNLVMSARLSAQKGVDIAILAMKLMQRSCSGGPDTLPVLHLFGDGPENDYLRALAESLHLADTVTFHGNVPDVVHRHVDADAILIPSRTEACPLVAMEAMSAGIPLIASAVGGVPEMVEDGVNGLLVDPESPRSLMEGVRRLLDAPTAAASLADQARETFRREYTARMMAERVMSVYERFAS